MGVLVVMYKRFLYHLNKAKHVWYAYINHECCDALFVAKDQVVVLSYRIDKWV
jgi:hypothetical protein